mmetsp:Transcript_135973/g.247938  ORF Transcript_135973/g.247938 Transcript_135973/m.247938 type:complete len:281 (+) Transcript_135973:93-935(+)
MDKALRVVHDAICHQARLDQQNILRLSEVVEAQDKLAAVIKCHLSWILDHVVNCGQLLIHIRLELFMVSNLDASQNPLQIFHWAHDEAKIRICIPRWCFARRITFTGGQALVQFFAPVLLLLQDLLAPTCEGFDEVWVQSSCTKLRTHHHSGPIATIRPVSICNHPLIAVVQIIILATTIQQAVSIRQNHNFIRVLVHLPLQPYQEMLQPAFRICVLSDEVENNSARHALHSVVRSFHFLHGNDWHRFRVIPHPFYELFLLLSGDLQRFCLPRLQGLSIL